MNPWGLLWLPALLMIVSCDVGTEDVVLFGADEVPERLGDWRILIIDGKSLRLNDRVVPYDLNTPLFSDYALKLRTVWMPPGTRARYQSDEEFDFPTGTVISKTFHYELANGHTGGFTRVVKADREAVLDEDGELDLERYFLAETRLLIRYEQGWKAYPYVWNSAQTEAFLEPAGELLNLELVPAEGESESIVYVVPDTNQCASCHTPDHGSKALRPLGPKGRQLNRDYAYASGIENQLESWTAAGLLEGMSDPPTAPAIANWSTPGDATPQERARAYLDVNCGHCHNPEGAADTSALNLNLEAEVDRRFGICKPPVAVGQGSGNRGYDIVPGRADASILVFRMESTNPAIAMPEIGRATSHAEGVAAVRQWIDGLDGAC